jgi:hypothetical protein
MIDLAMDLGFKDRDTAQAWLDTWLEQHCPALGCKPAEMLNDRPEVVERLLGMIAAGVYV